MGHRERGGIENEVLALDAVSVNFLHCEDRGLDADLHQVLEPARRLSALVLQQGPSVPRGEAGRGRARHSTGGREK
eukprot:39207-Pyramimonas_sp.AAC.1